MTTTVQKWGNSLGVRIPNARARQVGLRPGTPVRVTGGAGRVVIAPTAPRYSLARLLKKVTARNLHRETATGRPRGAETW